MTEHDPNDDAKKRVVRTRTPRPDELTAETLEFLTEVDRFKRDNMQSFLSDQEVLEVLLGLGYQSPDGATCVDEAQLESFAEARQVFRKDSGRLFPSWSEVFSILEGLGYARKSEAA